MPQPFNGASSYNLHSLKERPALASHIGLITAMWSLIDVQLAHMVSTMLHADAEIAATLLGGIRSEPVKLAAIQAVAEERLSSELLAEYTLLMKEFKSVSKARNDVVHKIWAVPDNKPESLVLIDSRKASTFNASLITSFAKPLGTIGKNVQEKYAKVFEDFIQSSMEYQENDFLDIENRIDQLSKKIAQFSMKLQQPTAAQIALAQFERSTPPK